tara:strand:+ start:2133 stop:2351 length:219 start_codon:yes stop_codon:yes gene_type:complete
MNDVIKKMIAKEISKLQEIEVQVDVDKATAILKDYDPEQLAALIATKMSTEEILSKLTDEEKQTLYLAAKGV